jgi:hypothetical protein
VFVRAVRGVELAQKWRAVKDRKAAFVQDECSSVRKAEQGELPRFLLTRISAHECNFALHCFDMKLRRRARTARADGNVCQVHTVFVYTQDT